MIKQGGELILCECLVLQSQELSLVYVFFFPLGPERCGCATGSVAPVVAVDGKQ